MEVQNNLVRVPSFAKKNKNCSFGSAARYIYLRGLADDIYKFSTGKSKVFQSLGLNNGENLNNVVTAVGTAGVAPIFIRYNPIAKEDKKTKAYSAWRQPISAVIALAFQLPIMTAYNNMVDKHASTLKIDRMDLSAKPRMAALKGTIDAEWRKEKAEALRTGTTLQNKADFYKDRLQHYQDEAFYAELKNLREKHKDMQINDFDLIKPEEFNHSKDEVFKSVLKDEFKVEQADLDAMKASKFGEVKKLEKKLFQKYNIQYSDFVTKTEEVAKEHAIKIALADIKAEAKVKLASTKQYLAMKQEFNKKAIAIDAMSDAEFRTKYPGIATRDAAKTSEDSNILKAAIAKLERKAETYKKGTADRDGIELVIKKLKKYNSISEVKPHGNTLDEVIQSVKIKKFLKVKINRAEEVLKNYKKQSGLIVGLAILPITCGILNWAYPRIMEKYFPELSAAKKSKTDNQNKVAEK